MDSRSPTEPAAFADPLAPVDGSAIYRSTRPSRSTDQFAPVDGSAIYRRHRSRPLSGVGRRGHRRELVNAPWRIAERSVASRALPAGPLEPFRAPPAGPVEPFPLGSPRHLPGASVGAPPAGPPSHPADRLVTLLSDVGRRQGQGWGTDEAGGLPLPGGGARLPAEGACSTRRGPACGALAPSRPWGVARWRPLHSRQSPVPLPLVARWRPLDSDSRPRVRSSRSPFAAMAPPEEAPPRTSTRKRVR